MKKVTIGDIGVIIPLAWIMSQTILHGGFIWGILALCTFNLYVSRRVQW